MTSEDGSKLAAFIMKLRGRGVTDARVLSALERTPREAFLPEKFRDRAYADEALAIPAGQFATQPFVIVLALHAANIGERNIVLDVGTGTGFQAAVLSRLCRRVFTMERQEALYHAARERFSRLAIPNAVPIYGDGAKGWPPQAPFDRIFVSAAISEDQARALMEQLADGGALVAPVGAAGEQQTLTLFRKGAAEQALARVRFPALVRGVAKA